LSDVQHNFSYLLPQPQPLVFLTLYRYKKLTAAKDLSTKTSEELRAILGAGSRSSNDKKRNANQGDLQEKDTKRRRKVED
jgi:hypothetical protein